jgi:hypothetical protein
VCGDGNKSEHRSGTERDHTNGKQGERGRRGRKLIERADRVIYQTTKIPSSEEKKRRQREVNTAVVLG